MRLARQPIDVAQKVANDARDLIPSASFPLDACRLLLELEASRIFLRSLMNNLPMTDILDRHNAFEVWK